MIQGTSSGAGKSIIATALCRILSDMGYAVAPFKSQNMSRYSYEISRNAEISSAQAVQAVAARCPITVHLNPVLLKPQQYASKAKAKQESAVYVEGKMYGIMDADAYYNRFVLSRGLPAATKSLNMLMAEYDIVVLEGAGSPAEINLTACDIANMKMAHAAGDAPVIIACDIDRGGAFASLAGTVSLLADDDARLVRGFVLNKFRGDESILKAGCDTIHEKTGIPVVGVIPMLDLSDIPDEDSLDSRVDAPRWRSGDAPPAVERGVDRLAREVKRHLAIEQILEVLQQ